MSKIELPTVPDGIVSITKCNPTERTECTIYKNEVKYLTEQKLEHIRNRSEEGRRAEFSGMERDIASDIALLCKSHNRIPRACPKMTNYTWAHNMEQLILVLVDTTGIDYEREATKIRAALGDIPDADEVTVKSLNELMRLQSTLDKAEIRERLERAGSEDVEADLAKAIEEAAVNSLLTWHLKYGIRCLNCVRGEIDKETEVCRTCGISYSYAYEKAIELLKKKEELLRQ